MSATAMMVSVPESRIVGTGSTVSQIMDQPYIQRNGRPLGIVETVKLTLGQEQRLRMLESYDLWFVRERLLRKNLVPDYQVDHAILEFKRYVALVVMGHQNLAMADEVVDEVWHAFILFTHEYADFCKAVTGQFLHHSPRTSRADDDPRLALDRMLNLYRTYYAIEPSWFRMKADSDACCTDCYDCIQCT